MRTEGRLSWLLPSTPQPQEGRTAPEQNCAAPRGGRVLATPPHGAWVPWYSQLLQVGQAIEQRCRELI